MVAAFAGTRNLCVLGQSLFGSPTRNAELSEIVPGQRVGQIDLEMSDHEVLKLLGDPDERREFEAESLERTLKVQAHVLQQLGKTFEVDPNHLQPATTYLNYYQRGLSIRTVHGKVVAVHVYTGIPSGYERGRFLNYFENGSVHGELQQLSTRDDILSTLGAPRSQLESRYATIPDYDIVYSNGISFKGRLDDLRVSSICIMKARQTTSLDS